MNTGSSSKRQLVAIAVFNAIYLAASTVAAVTLGNKEFVFYIVVMLVLVAVVAWVNHRIRLSAGALWALSAWGLLHMLGGLMPVPAGWPISGDIPVLYSLWLVPGWLKYDQVIHAYGFGITTWVCWQGLQAMAAHEGRTIRPTVGMMVITAAAGLGFGALNEIVEFIATLTVPETNVGGYENTGWDLVFNLIGVTIAAVVISLSRENRRT